jgi:hypothetical protein
MSEVILKNCELWYIKLDPKRPYGKYNKENPTWEVQVRTSDKDTKNKWVAQNVKVKSVVPDEGDPYWYVNLKRRSIKSDMTPNSPVECINGALKPVDGRTIGNGSIGNVKLYQYQSRAENAKEGEMTSILSAIQVTKHIVYTPKPQSSTAGFDETETEVIGDDGSFDSSAGADFEAESSNTDIEFDDDIPF